MATHTHPRVQYRCSFCGKEQQQVHRLIAGPGGVYICDECVELCQEIIADEGKEAAQRGNGTVHAGASPEREAEIQPLEDSGRSCPLCHQPIEESEPTVVITQYDSNATGASHLLLKCHAACFHMREWK